MEKIDYAKIWEDQKKAVAEAVARHSEEFGLRAFPGDIFKVVESASFWGEMEKAPLLYTFIFKEGRWMSFAKGTEAELLRNKVALPKVGSPTVDGPFSPDGGPAEGQYQF